MTRKAGRTQRCDAAQARTRLADAHAQLGLADLASSSSAPEERKAAAACAVVAGIAAADAACCAGLGERSRSQTHSDAADLLRLIDRGGETAAKQFGRLIGMKDAAQYGFDDISGNMLLAAQRQARALIRFAEGGTRSIAPGRDDGPVEIDAATRAKADAIAATFAAARRAAMPLLPRLQSEAEDRSYFAEQVIGECDVLVVRRERRPVACLALRDGKVEHLLVRPGSR